MKPCRDCNKKKPLIDFGTRKNYNKSGKVYYKSSCKKCMVQRMQKWIEKNREKYKTYQTKYNETIRN